MNYPPLIALAGFATAGKDSAADHLVKTHGYVKVGWADKLREAALALDPIVGWDERPVRYAELLSWVGYNGAKVHPVFGPEVRRTLIHLGTEVGRDVFGENFWVDLLVNSLDPAERYVIADTRFPNEASAVWAKGGAVIRVERPGVGAVADHPSETALVDFPYDAVLVNSGTLAGLGRALDAWLKAQS